MKKVAFSTLQLFVYNCHEYKSANCKDLYCLSRKAPKNIFISKTDQK